MTKQEQLTAIAKWFNDGGVWRNSKGLDRAYWAELSGKYSVGVGFANSNYYKHEKCDGCYTFTRAEVEAEQDRLKMEGNKECDGEGFPPVGVECEVLMDMGGDYEWNKCTILGHYTYNHTLLSWIDPEGFAPTVIQNGSFRPIKSDRDKWIELMFDCFDSSRNTTEALKKAFDAGLAKMPES